MAEWPYALAAEENDLDEVPACPSSLVDCKLIPVPPKLIFDSYSLTLLGLSCCLSYAREKFVSMTLLDDLFGFWNISPLVLRPMLK